MYSNSTRERDEPFILCVGDATRLVLLLGKDDQPLLLDGPHTHQWIAQDAQPIQWTAVVGNVRLVLQSLLLLLLLLERIGARAKLCRDTHGGARPDCPCHSCGCWWCGPSLGNAAPHTRGMGLKQDGHSNTVPSYGQHTSTRSINGAVVDRGSREVVVLLLLLPWSRRRSARFPLESCRHARKQYKRCLWFPRVECPDNDHDGRPNRYHSEKKNVLIRPPPSEPPTTILRWLLLVEQQNPRIMAAVVSAAGIPFVVQCYLFSRPNLFGSTSPTLHSISIMYVLLLERASSECDMSI